MRVIERQKAHYEVGEVPYGKVYSWRPERIRIECDCGETLVRRDEALVCGCGTDHTGAFRGVDEARLGEAHPWSEEYRVWREEKLANNVRREYYGFVGERDAR